MLGVSFRLITASLHDLVRVVTPEEMERVRPRIGGVRGGDARWAGAGGSAGEGRAVRARTVAGGQAQVDAADGGPARGRSSAVAAVRHVLDLGLRRGAARLAGWGGRVRGPAGVRSSTIPGSRRTARARPGWRGCIGALGKTGNCQIGVSVHAATDWALRGGRLAALPPTPGTTPPSTPAPPTGREAAAEIRARRARAGIGEQVRHREKWRLALDMLDERSTSGARRRAGGRRRRRRRRHRVPPRLSERGLPYVLAVTPRPPPPTRRRRAGHPALLRHRSAAPPRYPDPPADLRASPSARGGTAGRYMVGRHGRATPATHRGDAPPDSSPCGCARPTATSPAPPTAACPTAGCSPNGHPAHPSPPTTGCPPCPPTPRYGCWCGWPRSAGGSNTTTAN